MAAARLPRPLAPPLAQPSPALHPARHRPSPSQAPPGLAPWLGAGALAAGGRGGEVARGSRESCRAGIRDALRHLAPFWLPGHLGGASPVSGAGPGRRGRAQRAAAGC